MEPAEALTRIASSLLERRRDPRYRVQAFRRAAISVRDVPVAELRHLAERGRLRDLPNIGDTTAAVIAEALTGKTPAYLERLEQDVTEPGAAQATIRGRSCAVTCTCTPTGPTAATRFARWPSGP